MKKSEYKNFVGIYDNYFSEEQCDRLVDYFLWCENNNLTWNRQSSEGISEIRKKDDSCSYDFGIEYSYPNIQNHIQEFNDVFWNQCYKEYMTEYSVLDNFSQHTIFTYKVQRTRPMGGYHVWHCENGERKLSSRISTYILYLNDVEDGGETEMLYQSMRIKPKKGRLLIFPAGYTHAHRGNPPLIGEKFIMTGWLEFC